MNLRSMSEHGMRRLAWATFAAWLLLMATMAVLVALIPDSRGDPELVAWAVLNAPFAIVAMVILARQPRHPIGWIMMVLGLLAALPLTGYGVLAMTSGLPGGPSAFLLGQAMWAPAIVLIGAGLLLRFPTGELPSPAWYWVEWLAVPAAVLPVLLFLLLPVDFGEFGFPDVHNPLGVEWLGDLGSTAFAVLLLVPLVLTVGVVSLLIRFRRSSGVERQQLKWLTVAALLIGGLYLVAMVGGALNGALGDGSKPAVLDVIEVASGNVFALIPIAIGLAIMRYRLYDIDRIISRTLGYAVVTAVLAAVFAGLVVGLQALALPVIGGSELTVALSTLAVLALFGPVRRRVQAVVDRRFDRARYDAARVVNSFEARLRDRFDLDDVSVELLSTTHAALRPASATVWLKPPRAKDAAP